MWMARTVPLAYRVLPKCGCSSIGQVIHHIDHGVAYDGMIHDSAAPILKWGGKDDPEICLRFAEEDVFSFTFVRNPYRRLLSTFADKIFGYQQDGRRYFDGNFHWHLQTYGMSWGPKSNIADNFKAFVRFAADTTETNRPIRRDMHWTPCSLHLRYNFRRNPSWKLAFVGQVEHFQRDLGAAMARAGVAAERVPARVPRENTTVLPDMPITAFYGPPEIEIMQRVYAEDFELFGYGPNPEQPKPVRGIDVAAVNARFAAAPAPGPVASPAPA